MARTRMVRGGREATDELRDLRRAIADRRMDGSRVLTRIRQVARFDPVQVEQLVDDLLGANQKNARDDERVGYLLQYEVIPMLERRLKEEDEEDEEEFAERLAALRRQVEDLARDVKVLTHMEERLDMVEAYILGKVVEDQDQRRMPRLVRPKEDADR